MKRIITSVVILVGLMAVPLLALAGPEHDQVTVRGEILDLACYVAKGAKGAAHAGCAKACVKGGQPMGLLAEDGTVYLLVAGHDSAEAFDQAKEHAGATVEINGVAADRDGLKALEVQSVKAL